MIIDFHTHTFPEKIAAKTLAALGKAANISPLTGGTEIDLIDSMKNAGIDYSVTFPVATNPGQVNKLNKNIIDNKDAALKNGLIYFGCMHPDCEDYKSELRALASANVKGIKLHPAYQATDLDHPNMLRIIYEASSLDMVVLVHAGIDIGIPGHDFASIKHIHHVLEEIAPHKLVLAHMGGWNCWQNVEIDLTGAPVYLDTSFSVNLQSYHSDWAVNPQYKDNMDAEQFVRLCQKHGMDKILFATDSPWQSQKEYVAFLKEIPLSPADKNLILGENAKNLLHLY